MHDDTVAKRFGFSGGLVPGVDVMAYMMHQPVARWGRAFLERGLIDARFIKPVYDGEIAELTAGRKQWRAFDPGPQP
jgi:acyl dehydratase